MKLYSPFILLCSSACLASAVLNGNNPKEPQDLTQSICTDRPRTQCEVELDVPQACAGEQSSCPIVLFLHGSGGTNNWFKGTANVHDAGYIGVYPQGEGGWNTGPKNSNNCAWNDYECTTDPDEGDFIASIIAEIRDKGASGNVYVIGNSNGAALAHRLAANAGSELPIKGIVAKVTQLLESPERSGPGVLNYNRPSTSTTAVSVLSVMGTADGLIPYEGGSSSVFGGDENFKLMPALNSMQFWAAHNGCGDGYSIVITSTTTSAQHGTSATKYDYQDCPAGIFVEHYAINGGGHNAGGAEIDGDKIDYVVAYDFIDRVENAAGPGGETTPSPVSSPTVVQPTSSPVAAPTGSCVDDPDWAGKFNAEHTCDFIAMDPVNRCVWEDGDGVQANVACPEACDSDCSTPDVLCQDSAAKFTFKDQTKKKTCKFIGKNIDNTAKKCQAASSECPVTCQTGCTCFDTETSFVLNGKTKTCAWAGTKNTEKRCAKNKVRSNCPKVCGVC